MRAADRARSRARRSVAPPRKLPRFAERIDLRRRQPVYVLRHQQEGPDAQTRAKRPENVRRDLVAKVLQAFFRPSVGRPQGMQRPPAPVRVGTHPLEKRVVILPVRQVVELTGEGAAQQVFPTCCA